MSECQGELQTQANYNDVIRADMAMFTALQALQRGDIAAAEEALLPLPAGECPVIHHFCPGIYIREVHFKAGSLIIGHTHKTAHTNIFLKGKMNLLQPDGSWQPLEAPLMFVGTPGRKVAFIVEDTVFQNIFATELTDVEAIEEEFAEKSPAWKAVERSYRMGTVSDHFEDRLDYTAALAELGFTEEQARSLSERTEDLIPFPLGSFKVKLGESAIEGTGLFATADIAEGEVLAPARIGDCRTPAGRYTNHSATPNAKFVAVASGINLIATKPIKGCLGGWDGEEITIDYRQSFKAAMQYERN